MMTEAKPIPALRGLPMLGHSVRLLRDPMRFFEYLRRQGDVVSIRMGTMPVYVVNHHELIREILVDQCRKFEKGRQFVKLRPFVGIGLLTSDGEFHLRQRRIIQQAFQRRRIAENAEITRQLAEAAIASWPEGRPVDLAGEIHSLLLAIVTKSFFASELNADAVRVMRQTLPVVLSGMGWRALAPDLLERLPTPANRRFNRALTDIHQVIDDVIADYHRAGTDQGDLLSMLMGARDEGVSMPDQQVHDEAMTLMVAGSETNKNAVGWACYFLSEHPEVQRRVQAEADAARTDEELTYTRRVITEALRIYPPPWLTTRTATVDVDLGGYRIPAGSMALFSTYALHRDPVFYPEPHVFDPDRWLPERAERLPRGAFLPFGAGNRGCIGEQVAWSQMTIIVSTIARHWTLKPVPGRKVKPEAKIVLVSSAIPTILERRTR